MDADWKQPGKTCYWFINYTPNVECSNSCCPCDLCLPDSYPTRLTRNECPQRTEMRSGDCTGQMIKTSRLTSHTRRDKRPPPLHKPTATRPRPKTVQRSRQRAAGRPTHSFIMLTLLNLILLLYHLEAPLLGSGGPLFALAQDSESMIEVRRFLVPAQVRPGELRRLACQYELHGASLHAMKLFKDDKEFYRYTPSNPPGDQRLSFPGAGVLVDMSRSGERDVWLKINKRSTGQYKCQVTIEGKFISVSAEKRMEVVQAGTGSPSGDLSPSAAGTQTGGGGGGGGGMWRHHPATAAGSGGSRVSPGAATYLNQDQPAVRRLPGEMYGLNAVMQPSSVGSLAAMPSRPVLSACLLLAIVCTIALQSMRAARAR